MAIKGVRRNLKEEEIRLAQKYCNSASECARYLGVCFMTYKRAAEKYGLFSNCLNKGGMGVKDGIHEKNKIKYTPENIFNSPPSRYLRPKVILSNLISHGVRKNECEICGWKSSRIMDDKIPLVLCFKDRNERNYKSENMEICCYNCFHNHYDIRGRHRKKTLIRSMNDISKLNQR